MWDKHFNMCINYIKKGKKKQKEVYLLIVQFLMEK